MKVIVACECSGEIRDAFNAEGHEAMSCDLQPTERPGPHYQGDLFDVIDYPWDLAIFHPECTHLAVSGARHFVAKRLKGLQKAAVAFVMRIQRRSQHIPRTVTENPVSVLSTEWREPDQIIQPWHFGHPEFKATCLWLKGLPLLMATNRLEPPAKGTEQYKQWSKVHRESPGPNRKRNRSRTLPGVAAAMAAQWGRERGTLFAGAA